jgi:sterol desaturase/sphingolipid hydroxylase (fatty acid hydroxylase superfamily)
VHWFGVLTYSIEAVVYTIVICTVMERVGELERHPIVSRIPGTLMNIAQVILSAALAWPIGQLWDVLGIGTIVRVPLWQWVEPLGAIGYAIQLLTAVAVADFFSYWRHRAEHAWFWPIHAVHHAPTELFAANDIGHPAQVWFTLLFVSIPLSLIRFDGPGTPVVVAFVVSLLSYYIHSPIDVHFGPLRKVLVDNRYHRIHHSLEEQHFDKNFGICFSIWDRLFGTAYDPAPDEWPEVGVANLAPPRSIGEYLLLPLRVIRGEAADGGSSASGKSGECLNCANSWPTK